MSRPDSVRIPFYPYRLFFLYIEPVSALLGALYAAQPATYLSLLTLSASSTTPLPTLISFQPSQADELHPSPSSTAISMALYQLANLYFLFALNEHFVLSSTNSIRTWRRLIAGLLVADVGHLLSMLPLALEGDGNGGIIGGWGVYWKAWQWNAMVWGSVGFVYLGAAMRISFLCGLGLQRGGNGPSGTRAAERSTQELKQE